MKKHAAVLAVSALATAGCDHYGGLNVTGDGQPDGVHSRMANAHRIQMPPARMLTATATPAEPLNPDCA
jgi:hypothetical protein